MLLLFYNLVVTVGFSGNYGQFTVFEVYLDVKIDGYHTF